MPTSPDTPAPAPAPQPSQDLDPAEPEPDPEAFATFVKTGGQPALAALIGNVFHIRREPGSATFFFDHAHANLIPMLRSPQYMEQLAAQAKKYFRGKCDIHFTVGRDPRIRAQREREERAMDEVRADPKIQFLLEQFKGTIINCEILKEGEE